MRTVLLLNWGLGLEVLKAVETYPGIDIGWVVTHYDSNNRDVWYNCVFDYSRECGYPTAEEKSVSLECIRQFIQTNEIDLLLCHGYMKKIPRTVFLIPSFGSVNVHPSLLPHYRGPSPTYWVVRNGEPKTGLTSHYIDDGMDTGDIIAQREIDLDVRETVDSVIEKMKPLVAGLMEDTLNRLQDPSFVPYPQTDSLATYAPRPR